MTETATFAAQPDKKIATGDAETDIASGRRVLTAEAAALSALAQGLDANFATAVDLLTRKAGGRVIVTGMGESGHVARKIAATLASTGTPSHYVHPAEASHGDLGMVTAQDAILGLSNSGETRELADLIEYSRRFAIPLVAITSGPDSMLVQAADVAIILPDMGEACPMGLTPTTSTTMMLALGDALAVALLERNHFTAADFKRFHPGGPLGKRLLRVVDLMHSGDAVPLIEPTRLMSEALLVMTAKSFGCVGVVDGEGRLIGLVTDGDLRRHMEPNLMQRKVADVMTRRPRTACPGQLAAEALQRMNAHSITALFVVDPGDRPVGLIHVHDCLRAGIV